MKALDTPRTSHWPLTLLTSFSSVLNIGLPMIMARIFPAHEVGIFRMFFLYLMVVPALSLNAGIINGLYFWAGKNSNGKKEIAESGALLFWIGLIFTTLAWLTRSQWNTFIELPPSTEWLFIACIFPTVLATFYESSCIAQGRLWTGALFSASFELIRAVILLGVIVYFRTLEAVLLTHLVMMIFKVFIGFILGIKDGITTFRVERQDIGPIIKYALPVSIAAVFDLIVTSSDRFILTKFIEPAEFAIYAIGCLSLPPLQMLEQSINKVLIPKLAKALERKETLQAKFLYREAMSELSFFLIPAVCGIFIFSDPLIQLLFSSRFSASAYFLKIYAFTYLLYAIPQDAAFRATGSGRWILTTSIKFGLVSMIGVYLMTRFYGATGALLTSILVQLSIRMYSLFQIRVHLKWNFKDFIPYKTYLKSTSIAITLAVITQILKHHFSSERVWFLICGPLFAMIYLVLGFQLSNPDIWRKRLHNIDSTKK